jgi:Zn-dependent peptidase ImmA (M78 family)
MSTVKKGDAFEARSYGVISRALHNLKLGLIPECCKVFAKKGYYSKDRESEIIFDLSIEVWLPGALNYSWLLLIECKDLGHNVPVDDLEEFKTKVGQVSRAAKPVFLSTTPLSKGGKTFAKNNQIMVIHVDEKDKDTVILYNSKKKPDLSTDTDFLSIQEELRELSEIQSFLFSDLKSKDFNWNELLEKFLKHALAGNLKEEGTSDTPIIGLERLSSKRIVQMTSRILDDFDPNVQKHLFAPNLGSFISYLQASHGLTVITDQHIVDQKGRVINGSIDLKNKMITIDRTIAESERFAFVLLHEVAHYFLHTGIQVDQETYDNLSDAEYNSAIGKHELVNERHWMEWQANHFAACILMPEWVIKYRLILYQTEHYIRNKGTMYVDSAPHNIQLFKETIDHLASYFRVSHSVMEYRMADLGIIRYASGIKRPSTAFTGKLKSAKTISQIFKKMEFRIADVQYNPMDDEEAPF